MFQHSQSFASLPDVSNRARPCQATPICFAPLSKSPKRFTATRTAVNSFESFLTASDCPGPAFLRTRLKERHLRPQCDERRRPRDAAVSEC
eukprot:7729624-Alexandrium_andersonii.AAC.1